VLIVGTGIGLARVDDPEDERETAAVHAIDGSLVLRDRDGSFADGCAGDGAYDDVRPGGEVVVSDTEDHVLARAALGASHGAGMRCIFEFTVEDVPRADAYRIAVGHQPDEAFSYDELADSEWHVALALDT
jgi:hypothetical protein